MAGMIFSKLGARPYKSGFRFSCYAPHCSSASVVGDFNGWDCSATPMTRSASGVWRVNVPGLRSGERYKYCFELGGERFLRADPCAFFAELRPATASVTCSLPEPVAPLAAVHAPAPLAIYELHAGSWRSFEGGVSYRALARALCDYLSDTGFTHVELMPIAEYPFDGSWGYQATGWFAPTSRYGTPEDFAFFVNTLHAAGIGVILDWVPAHFTKDAHGLRLFDGAPLFEPADSERAEIPQWGTLCFDFTSPEVRDFLISSALFWLGQYGADGLRVDAVSAILSAEGGPAFLRQLNSAVARRFPDALMIAEDSSDFPGVTAPVRRGGLGFTHKWNMGWMNDTLKYMQCDPLWRGGSHELMTFPMVYAFREKYVLPLSHDECVHGKKSLIDKMSGSYYDKFASLRAYYAYMFTHPGGKLLFMGGEFGQFIEWRWYEPLEWKLLSYETHSALQRYTRTLTLLYRRERALWSIDGSWDGFIWANADDKIFEVFTYFRIADTGEKLFCAINMTPAPRPAYLTGSPFPGNFELIFNSDDPRLGGSGRIARKTLSAAAQKQGSHPFRLELDLPPYGALIYKNTEKGEHLCETTTA